MNVRDQQRYERLRRIVAFLLAHVELREAVDRSGVIPILQAFISEIAHLDQGNQTVQLEAPALTAERNALRRRLWEKLEAIGCASDIARRECAGMPSLHPPPFGKVAWQLPTNARSIHQSALAHREDLLRAGLLPSLIDEVRPLGDLLETLETHRTSVVVADGVHAGRIPELIRTSSQTVKLVRRQFEPLMSPSTRAEWDAVVSLGRVHRPKALPRGRKPAIGDNRRPALPRVTLRMVEGSQTKSTRKRGIVRRLVDLVHPAKARREPPTIAADVEPDVQIEEVKRLPASTESPPTD